MRRHTHLRPWYFSPIVVIACVFLGLTWVGLLYQGPRSMEDAVSLASATSPVSQVGASGIEVRAWAGRALIRSGDNFEFWILIKNTSKLPLANLRILEVDSPGFVPFGNCWIGGVPGCRPGVPSANQPAGLETSLTPGTVGMAFAELKSFGLRGGTPRPLTARIAWTRNQKEESLRIQIQPVEVAPHAPQWVVAVYSLLKDFGLPLLLGILAYFFQQIQQERSRAHEAHSAILPTATTNATNYMLPAAAASRNMRNMIEEAGQPNHPQWQEKQQQAFFYFVLLLKKMRDLNSVGGGFFFADVSSEVLAARCWRAVYRHAIEHFGYLNLSYTQDLLGEHHTISYFLDQFNKPLNPAQAAARKVAENFPSWSADKSVLCLLDVLEELMQIEANRLHLGWYDKVDSPDETTLQRWAKAIRDFQNAHYQLSGDLATLLKNYIKDLPWNVRRRYAKL